MAASFFSRFRAARKQRRRRAKDVASLLGWTETDAARLEHYREFIGPESIVFDVGANLGNRAKIFAKLAKKVVAFEPQPYCLGVLEEGLADVRNVVVLPVAVGAAPGTAKLMISDAHTISSMSQRWVTAVRESGRFSGHEWRDEIEVPLVTLDQMVDEHGLPDFIKIDVEGFEAEVLAGLSKPARALSFEFTPEHLEPTHSCIDRLLTLGDYQFNLALGESMTLDAENWLDADAIKARLAGFSGETFGDVYASLPRP